MNVIQFIGGVVFCLLVAVTIACAILLFTGCTAVDEAQGTPAATGSAIVFSARADSTVRGAATRTAQGTITVDGTGSTVSLQEQGFGVFACHTGTHPYVSTSTTANLLHNQLVQYDAVNSVWQYNPLVYWPNGVTGDKEYVSFFAYGPHSTSAANCIVDMSRPDEVGDPWILYQLGGTSNADGPDGWKACQVDLLYDFQRDQQRGDTPGTRVDFDFKHALACIGDRITVRCDESVTDRLKGVYEDTPIQFTVTRIAINYQLTRKGRLVLNGSSQPNWQAVESEDAKVSRTLEFTPNLVMARATSASEATSDIFETSPGHGIFYIPIESGGSPQQVTVTISYTITADGSAEPIEEGSASSTIDLSFICNASEGRNLNITFAIPI